MSIRAVVCGILNDEKRNGEFFLKKIIIIKRLIGMFPAILAMALLLQGCGEEVAPVNQIFGKWEVSKKLTANDKGNKDLNRFILEFAIDIYNKHFEIKPLEEGEGVSFNFSGLLPEYFKILEMNDKHVSLENMKTKEKLDIKIRNEWRIMFTTPELKHPLVTKPAPVVIHLLRIEEKKRK